MSASRSCLASTQNASPRPTQLCHFGYAVRLHRFGHTVSKGVCHPDAPNLLMAIKIWPSKFDHHFLTIKIWSSNADHQKMIINFWPSKFDHPILGRFCYLRLSMPFRLYCVRHAVLTTPLRPWRFGHAVSAMPFHLCRFGDATSSLQSFGYAVSAMLFPGVSHLHVLNLFMAIKNWPSTFDHQIFTVKIWSSNSDHQNLIVKFWW